VFGNGTRVVWRFYRSPHDEGEQGALIQAVKAGLIAVEEGQGVRGLKAAEDGDHAVQRVAFRMAGSLGIDEAGFHGPGPALAPAGGGHFLDHGALDITGGPEAVKVLLQEKGETVE